MKTVDVRFLRAKAPAVHARTGGALEPRQPLVVVRSQHRQTRRLKVGRRGTQEVQ